MAALVAGAIAEPASQAIKYILIFVAALVVFLVLVSKFSGEHFSVRQKLAKMNPWSSHK